MKTKPLIIAAVVVVAILLILAIRYQRTLVRGLPPRVECANEQEAARLAADFSVSQGGSVVSVLGTGSMAPYIPAAKSGLDPLATTDALAATKPGVTFDDITPGALCIYRHNASSVGLTMHSAARKSFGAWVMAGLHNKESDIWMKREDFVGIVGKVWVWK